MNHKVALVTGASSGIGEATAERLAASGYRVFGTSRRGALAAPRTFEMLTLDVTSDRSVDAAVKEVLQSVGRISRQSPRYSVASPIRSTLTAPSRSRPRSSGPTADSRLRPIRPDVPARHLRRARRHLAIGPLARLGEHLLADARVDCFGFWFHVKLPPNQNGQ